MSAFDQRGQNVSGSQFNVGGKSFVIDQYVWERGRDEMGSTRTLSYLSYDAIVKGVEPSADTDRLAAEYVITRNGKLIARGYCPGLSSGMPIVEEIINYLEM